MALSIVEKMKNFRDAAEQLREPLTPKEIAEMKTDLKDHAGAIWERILFKESEAKRLKSDADKLVQASKSLEKDALADKQYLLDALQGADFDRVVFGNFSMAITERRTVGEKRPATERDFAAHPDLVTPAFDWAKAPDISDAISHPELIEKSYKWDMPKLRSDKKTYAPYLEFTTNKYVTVKVDKKGKK